MSDKERVIEATTRPLAETNAELHLATQQELLSRVEDCDPAIIKAATLRLERSSGSRWITIVLIVMGFISLAILGGGFASYRKWVLAKQVIDFQFPDSPPKSSKALTEHQRLLLYGDTRESDPANQWKALWDSRPDHPPYFVEYAAAYMQEHDALPPDFLKIAEAIDPDNGWYLAAAAAFEGDGSTSKGSLSRKEQDERKPVPLTIEDMAKHQAALMKTLPTFTQALQKSAISTSSPNTPPPNFIANQRTTVMKTNCLIPAFLIGASLHSVAQGPPQGPPPSPIAMTLDKDHDHEISKREVKNAAKQLLKLDKDKDGTVSAEELNPEPPRHERRRTDDDQNPPPAPPPSELLKALDTDGSGDLSADEVEAASESLTALDTDEDGTLSPEEAGLGHPDNGGGPGGPGGRPPGGPRH